MTITPDGPNAPITDEWLARQSFEAEITDELGEQIERRRAADEHDAGQSFRIALGVLTRSSDELIERSRAHPERSANAFLDAMESLRSSIEQRKRELELMESADARLLILATKLGALAPDLSA